MIKIVFFDIDGTLLNLGSKVVTDKVQYALNKLKENGIKIFIATGRPSYMVPDLGVTFDGILSFNGQYCFDNNNVIYSNPLNPNDVQSMLHNLKEMNEPVVLAGKEKMGCNYHKENLDAYFTIATQVCHTIENFDEFSQGDIYQAMVGVVQKRDIELLKDCTDIVTTRWWPYACDVIPKNGGKEYGIEKILEYYGFTVDECMAFGDGGNDKTMIQYAGLGVAMGNAVDDVKEVANYVCDSCENDGVYSALLHFNLI